MTPHATTASAQTSDLDVRIATLEAGMRDLRRQLAELRGMIGQRSRNGQHRGVGLRQIGGATVESFCGASSQERERRIESIGRDKVVTAVRRLFPNLDERSASWPVAIDRVINILSPSTAQDAKATEGAGNE
jgi:hypothetical protein